jgi:aminoglycoside phosphotransferase (APT) family kinase protein
MRDEQKPHISLQDVAVWLDERYDGVSNLSQLGGGFWSSAFAYRAGNNEYVLRLSNMREGFAIDKAAMRFTSPDIPAPEIVETGNAFERYFAISRRHYGRFVETASTFESAAVADALSALLRAMRAAVSSPDAPVLWYDAEQSRSLTWRSWIRSGLVDSPDKLVNGWRVKLASNPRLNTLFNACESRIEQLLPACPERRDLIHGDLLHQNVLISDDARRVTAIFSWKCSVLGDFLFDVAWLTFWSPWHPVIAQTDIWRRTLMAPDLSENDLVDASARHHCYELLIAASHLGWYIWTGDHQTLRVLADTMDRILERGPLSIAG